MISNYPDNRMHLNLGRHLSQLLEILILLNFTQAVIRKYSRSGSSEIWLQSHLSDIASANDFNILRFLQGVASIWHYVCWPEISTE